MNWGNQYLFPSEFKSRYDKHREALLRGLSDSDSDIQGINLLEFFTASCYKGYDDDSQGFYSVYNNG
jgi:DnaJ family protein A protein 5